MSLELAGGGLRLRLRPSRRLACLQAGLMGAVACAVWLVVAPRWGTGPAVGAMLLVLVWLAWRGGMAHAARPDALVVQPAGRLAWLGGTPATQDLQLSGFVQWPGMLALELVAPSGARRAVLLLSDSLAAPEFWALAAWSRRHEPSLRA